jgi:hypothetical protein
MERFDSTPYLQKAGRVVRWLLLGSDEPLATHGDHFLGTPNGVEHELGRLVMGGKLTADEAYQQIQLFDAPPDELL